MKGPAFLESLVEPRYRERFQAQPGSGGAAEQQDEADERRKGLAWGPRSAFAHRRARCVLRRRSQLILVFGGPSGGERERLATERCARRTAQV